MWPALALLLAVNPHLDEGRRLYEQLKYPEAEARLQVAAQSPGNTAEESAQIADLLARALIAQGRAGDAERVWAELLAKQPDAADPAGASPKIRDVFVKAKRSVYPDDFVKLERKPSAPGRYEAELLDPWRKVKTVTLNGAALPMTRRFAGALPVGASKLEARDPNGAVLGTLEWTLTEVSSAQTTLVDGPAPEPPGPARWPVALSGAVAGAGVIAGTVLAVLAAQDYGRVKPDTDAATTRALDASARSKALGANVAFGGALAAGVVTAVIVWSW